MLDALMYITDHPALLWAIGLGFLAFCFVGMAIQYAISAWKYNREHERLPSYMRRGKGWDDK